MQQQQPKPQQQQLPVKKEQSSSYDNAIMDQVLATHSPDGRVIDLEPILHVIEETLHNAIPASFDGVNEGTHDGNAGEEKAAFTSFDDDDRIPDSLSHVIHKISCEFSCKCSGGDAHASTMAILKMLSSYAWEAKMVISLGAFSVNVGEFWLVAQLIATNNPLAKSVALLKRLPNIIEHFQSLEPWFKPFNDLIKAMLEVTKCIIKFKKLVKLPDQYLQYDGPPKSKELTHVPSAAYSCIISMVACVTQLTSLLGMNYKYIATSEAWAPLNSADHMQVYDFHKHLKELKDIAAKEEREIIEIEETFYRPQGILDINAFFGANPLFHGSSKSMVDVDVLSGKSVLLLISDLDISHEKVKFLTEIYSTQEANHQYEVIWVPVVDNIETWNASQHKFEQLRKIMKWHVLQHPESLKPDVISYVKQEWHFERKPILVVLDEKRSVISSNALHMIYIWENDAYPFTSKRERELFEKESEKQKKESEIQSMAQSLALRLLVDSNDQSKGIAEKYICFFGGDNVLWSREFTKLAATVAHKAAIELQMVYVGKSGTEERIEKIHAKTMNKISDSEKNLIIWMEPDKVWSYWTCFERMLYSKMQDKIIDENDLIMEEVMTLMSFDRSGQGWALICKGSEMARVNADLALQSLEDFSEGRKNIPKDVSFVAALRDYFRELQKSEHCNHIILPWINGWAPKVLKCSVCEGTMEKFVMFRCCTD